MKIQKVPLPETMIVHKYLLADYTDTFRVSVVFLPPVFSADDLQIAFWTDQPDWVARLMRWRNAVVALLGLQTAEGDPQKFADSIRIGGAYRFVCHG